MLPQAVRTTGHSAANAVARLGGAMSPYLVTSEKPFSFVGSVIMVVGFLAALASWKLPETKGKCLGLNKLQRKPAALEKEVELKSQGEYSVLD
mmetsp:Transcript_415/g.1156  ORF Transcript_415/g.1156 Transcript_415/m.1156 type:complete len:93 (+) Transcript_415:545-823(+)